jgi:hypothetical protein
MWTGGAPKKMAAKCDSKNTAVSERFADKNALGDAETLASREFAYCARNYTVLQSLMGIKDCPLHQQGGFHHVTQTHI